MKEIGADDIYSQNGPPPEDLAHVSRQCHHEAILRMLMEYSLVSLNEAS